MPEESTGAETPAPICLLILGMHRSGTSALARTVNLLGANLGDKLMGATPSNPRGHWERIDLYDLHEHILSRLASSWSDYRPIEASAFENEEAAIWRSHLVEIIRDGFGDSPLRAIKDPRICRLMALWRAAALQAGVDLRVILAIRHPLEVAASLDRRDPMPRAEAMKIWLAHVIDAENQSRGLKRTVVCYEDLLTDWRTVMARVGADLGVDWPKWEHPINERVIDLTLNSGDRHHRHPKIQDATPEVLEALASEVYERLTALSGHEASAWASPTEFDTVAERCRAVFANYA